jgi:hypothetical protein
MSRKLSLTAQWMLDHPDDEPCPPGSDYMAVRWRRERGLVDRRPKAVRDREKALGRTRLRSARWQDRRSSR